jgi:hypothetical protein
MPSYPNDLEVPWFGPRARCPKCASQNIDARHAAIVAPIKPCPVAVAGLKLAARAWGWRL